MTLTTREQKLVLVLPAMIVILVYALFPFRSQMTRKNQATLDEAQARAKAPTDLDVDLQRAKLLAAQKELDKQSKEFAAINDRWRSAAGKANGIPSRPERIEKLNELCSQAGLHVIEAMDGEAHRDERLFPSLETLAKELTALSENQQPRRWLIRFEGTYADVLMTL